MSINRRDMLKGCIGVLGAAATAAVARYAEAVEKKEIAKVVSVKNVEMRAGRAIQSPDFPDDCGKWWHSKNVMPYGAPYEGTYHNKFDSLDTEAILADMKKRNHNLWMNHRGEIKVISDRIDYEKDRRKISPTEWERMHNVSERVSQLHAGRREWIESPEHNDFWANYDFDKTYAGKLKLQKNAFTKAPYSKEQIDKEEAVAKMAVKTHVGWWTKGY